MKQLVTHTRQHEACAIKSSHKYLLVLMTMVMALSGCVSKVLQSKVPEPGMYVLHAAAMPVSAVAYPVTVAIARPTPAPGLEGDRIAVLTQANQLDYYRGARWGGTTSAVMQSFLIDALQSQHALKSVHADVLPVSSDYLLALELRDFQAETIGNNLPAVRVTLRGSLLAVHSRSIVATLDATAKVTARANNLSDVVAAYEQAAQQATAQLSTQLLAAIEKDAATATG